MITTATVATKLPVESVYVARSTPSQPARSSTRASAGSMAAAQVDSGAMPTRCADMISLELVSNSVQVSG